MLTRSTPFRRPTRAREAAEALEAGLAEAPEALVLRRQSRLL